MEFDFTQNYFQLFGFEENYRLDTLSLEQQYHTMQTQVHPDKFADLAESERRLSMQWATRTNEAYQALRNPLARGRYLLSLRGVDTQEETNTAMPLDFLMEQMKWREAIAEARVSCDMTKLENLEARLKQETQSLHQSLAFNLDDNHEYSKAAEAVRKLKFMEKLAEEISSAFDQVDV